VKELINAYARDSMGNGAPLSQDVLDRLIPGLRNHPTTLIFLAYLDEPAVGGDDRAVGIAEPAVGGDDRAVGIAVCFRGFSTFHARPLINIHDLAVLPEHRGRGIGRALLSAVEEHARSLDCCKLTLEVLENNRPARALYGKLGFHEAVYTEAAGPALFLVKSL
jgi:ribosomal protein S18 acetylase RimI-like enzyme